MLPRTQRVTRPECLAMRFLQLLVLQLMMLGLADGCVRCTCPSQRSESHSCSPHPYTPPEPVPCDHTELVARTTVNRYVLPRVTTQTRGRSILLKQQTPTEVPHVHTRAAEQAHGDDVERCGTCYVCARAASVSIHIPHSFPFTFLGYRECTSGGCVNGTAWCISQHHGHLLF